MFKSTLKGKLAKSVVQHYKETSTLSEKEQQTVTGTLSFQKILICMYTLGTKKYHLGVNKVERCTF